MVENTILRLNALPVKSGTSSTISPQTLMTGTTIGFKKHCKIQFSAYAEAHEKTFPYNFTQYRIEPSI